MIGKRNKFIDKSYRRIGLPVLIILGGICSTGCGVSVRVTATGGPVDRAKAADASARTLFEKAKSLATDGEALKKEGRAAEAARKYEKAVDLFKEADRLDHNIIVTRWLAECNEQLGRRGSAFVEYSRLAREAEAPDQAKLREEANQQLKKIGPVAMLTVVIPSSLANLEGLRVERDGERLSRDLWNTPVPIDGGDHVINVRAPERATWSEKVTIVEDSPASNKEVRAPATMAEAPLSRARVAAIITGAGAGAAVIVAGGFAAAAAAEWSHTKDLCGVTDPAQCKGMSPGFTSNREAILSSRQKALTFANISNAAFGATAVAAGFAIWLGLKFPKYNEDPAPVRLDVVPTEGGAIGVIRGSASF